VVTAAGNKEDLAAIGRIKHAQNGGDKVSKKATGVVINDKAAQADATPKHDTRKAMAEAAGVSTGLVAQ